MGILGSTSNNNESSTPPASTSSFPLKRRLDQMDERQMRVKRSVHDASDSDMNDSIDNMNHDDIFLPAAMQPQVTLNESPRYDNPGSTSVKRENSDTNVVRPQTPTTIYRSTYSEF